MMENWYADDGRSHVNCVNFDIWDNQGGKKNPRHMKTLLQETYKRLEEKLHLIVARLDVLQNVDALEDFQAGLLEEYRVNDVEITPILSHKNWRTWSHDNDDWLWQASQSRHNNYVKKDNISTSVRITPDMCWCRWRRKQGMPISRINTQRKMISVNVPDEKNMNATSPIDLILGHSSQSDWRCQPRNMLRVMTMMPRRSRRHQRNNIRTNKTKDMCHGGWTVSMRTTKPCTKTRSHAGSR